ncbi:MAG TPA: cellulase family glycosylhydrolase, partial [Opitutaceae bacterium]
MQTYVEAMQPGWNLGNTLDATPNETAWGNPLATQELIQQIKAQGFKSIRIPVTWDTGGRVGPAPDYTIDPAFLDRVQQVVDWSLDAGLYVMLNLHHDSGWVRAMPTNHDAVLAKFNALWSQIAPRFRDYPRELHFESINEPEFDGVNDATKNALLHELNTSFFNIVRSTGGGNATRPLVLPSVVTNNGQVFLDALLETITELNDPNLIATVHEYGFWPFAVNITGVTEFEGVAQEWTTSGIDRVYDTLVSKGIPVIVGEIGLLSFGGFNGAIERGEALQFFEHTMSYYRSKGMTYQWWDAGNFFNRSTFQWNVPDIYDYMMHSAVGRSSTAESDLIFLRDGTPLQDAVINLNLNGNTFIGLDDGATPLVLGSDYEINGSVLTIKASALAAYASGAFGEKTVLTAHFSDGVPWKFFVRHQAAPALGVASATKSGALVIPTAFNGDVLATMEARYVADPNFPYPGPTNWTAFKLYGDVYQPNYADNTITIKKEFFAETTNEAVDLTFHFWSGKKVSYRLTFEPGGGVITDPQELVIYDNQFQGVWANWSWTPTNENSEEVVYSPTKSIAVDANPWTGSMFGNWMLPLDRSDYRTLTVWANGGA